MVRDNFNQELDELNQDILKLGSMVEETIHNSVTALKEQDCKLATKVIENDDKLDDYEIDIEKKCIRLVALQQPVAKDLRQIDMVSKIASDLERIGDLSQNIAEIVHELANEELIKPLVDIPRMANLTQKMVRDSLEAFVNGDAEQAKKVGQKDNEIDNLDSQIFRELVGYMVENPSAIKQANRLMFVSRYLERIGDHATNICERVIYIVTGERVSY